MTKTIYKSVLITDLDNTLFDWVDYWYASFDAMISYISSETHVPKEILIPEIRAIHSKHGTSEYAYLLEEMESIKHSRNKEGNALLIAKTMNIYHEARARSLKLYPTVLKTLKEIKSSGSTIVAYTESMAVYSIERLVSLQLDGIIDVVFSPENHDIPTGLSAEQLLVYRARESRLVHTVHKHTPKGSLKPDPTVLADIVKQIGATIGDCVYVGDSLFKDIAMAVDLKMDHAWAKYGEAQDRDAYNLLKKVTHWTDIDVQREAEIRKREIKAQHILKCNMEEILNIFSFGGSHDRQY